MTILKWEFGIGLRDKQKLNLDGKCQKYVRGVVLPMTKARKHLPKSWLGTTAGREVSYGWLHRAVIWEPHLECHLFQLQGKKWWVKWCAVPCWACAHSDEMVNCFGEFGDRFLWYWAVALHCCCDAHYLEAADPLTYLRPFTHHQKAMNFILYCAAVAFILAMLMISLLM